MPSINAHTGLFFTPEQVAAGEDFLQSVFDRIVSPLGERPDRPNYGSLVGFIPFEDDELRQSIEASLRGDPRVRSVQFAATDRELIVNVNGNIRATITGSVVRIGVDDDIYQYEYIWQDSISVLGVKNAVNNLSALSNTIAVDVVDYISPLTIPRPNLRLFLSNMGMPSTDLLGETFERAVYGKIYQYFSLRDTRAGLDLLSEDAPFAYVFPQEGATPGQGQSAWYLNDDSRRVGIHFCISPVLSENVNSADWLIFIADWIKWMLPRFAPDRSPGNAGIVVALCESEIIQMQLVVSAAMMQQHVFVLP